MALKTIKKIQQKQHKYSWLRQEIAKRHPDYSSTEQELFGRFEEVDKKYSIPSIDSPEYSNAIDKLDSESLRERQEAYFQLIEKFKEKFNLSTLYVPGLSQDAFLTVFAATSPVRLISKEGMLASRFLDFRVDTFIDLEILKHTLASIIKTTNKFRQRHNIKIPKQDFSRLHLNKAAIYIKVFDMRSQKPPVSYEGIVGALMKDGFYKGVPIENAICSVRKDYSLIYEEIYGVKRRKYDGKSISLSTIPTCDKCPKRKECEAQRFSSRNPKSGAKGKNEFLCAEVEYLLQQTVAPKQQNRLGSKKNVTEKYDSCSEEKEIDDSDDF